MSKHRASGPEACPESRWVAQQPGRRRGGPRVSRDHRLAVRRRAAGHGADSTSAGDRQAGAEDAPRQVCASTHPPLREPQDQDGPRGRPRTSRDGPTGPRGGRSHRRLPLLRDGAAVRRCCCETGSRSRHANRRLTVDTISILFYDEFVVRNQVSHSDTGRYFITSLAKGIEVLSCFGAGTHSLSLKEL